MEDKPTIYDVAAHAEVSTSTVSRVLNRSDKVSPDTRERVEKAIESLDYRPNQVAQRLGLSRRKSGRSTASSASETTSQATAECQPDGMPRVRVHFEGDWTPAERERVRRAIVEVEAKGASTEANEIWICTLLQVAGQAIYLASPLAGEKRPVKGNSVSELARQLSVVPS